MPAHAAKSVPRACLALFLFAGGRIAALDHSPLVTRHRLRYNHAFPHVTFEKLSRQ
jgi:hypothetical protein